MGAALKEIPRVAFSSIKIYRANEFGIIIEMYVNIDIQYWPALALVGLCVYSWIIGPRKIDTIPEVLEASYRADGLELSLGADSKVVDLQDSGFLVEQLGERLAVRIAANLQTEWMTWRGQLEMGDFLSMRAVYHAGEGGYLLLQELHIHKGRRLKMFASLVVRHMDDKGTTF